MGYGLWVMGGAAPRPSTPLRERSSATGSLGASTPLGDRGFVLSFVGFGFCYNIAVC